MTKPPIRVPEFPADQSLIDFVVRGARIEVMPVKGFTSYNSILQVAEADADLVLPVDTISMLVQTGERIVPGYFPLGRFFERTPTSDDYSWSCIAGPKVIVDEVAHAYVAFIKNAGHWRDLATMFRSRYGHDPLTVEPAHQPTVRWFWTAVPLDAPGAQPIKVLEDEGLYVDPDDGLIRVYSNRLDAVRVTKPLYAKGMAFQAYDIPCLGCFLTGAAAELGPDRVRGALIDGQWKVQMFTCGEHGNDRPSHLVIDDGSAQYDLIGCAERGWPRWAERRWRGSVYTVECDLRPW